MHEGNCLMAKIQSLYTWLNSKHNVIDHMIKNYQMAGKKMILWGAGQRGCAFLEIYDPEAKYISVVYDSYQPKQNTVLPTGHKVVPPGSTKADVIFCMADGLERQIYQWRYQHKEKAEVVNIVNVIFDDGLHRELLSGRSVRTAKICGLVILYHPSQQNFLYIQQYADQLDSLVLFDNSPESNQDLVDRMGFSENVVYHWNQGDNIGLGEPINRLVAKLQDSDFDWVLTFDQDSLPADDMILKMRQFIDSDGCVEDIAIVSPLAVTEKINHERYLGRSVAEDSLTARMMQEYGLEQIKKWGLPPCLHTCFIVQSGMLQRIKTIHALGGYDENLFIEAVDYDYVVRCLQHGYNTIQLNDCFMMHEVEDDQYELKKDHWRKVMVNKYSPLRYYYRYRNMLYCKNKFRGSAYEFIWDEVLQGIERMIPLERQSKKVALAIKKAKDDYRNGEMGKWRT